MATPTISGSSEWRVSIEDTNITITGTNFNTTQSTGKVELCQSSNYTGRIVTQSIDSWSATSIQFDIVQGDLSPGDVYIFVSNSDPDRSTGFKIQLGLSKNWGYTNSNIGKDVSVNWWRSICGYSPNKANMRINAINVFIGADHGSQVRLAIYTGGTTSNPSGATRIVDCGQTTGSGTNEWVRIPFTAVSWAASTLTWIALKGDSTANIVRCTVGDSYDSTYTYEPLEYNFLPYPNGGTRLIILSAQNPATAFPSTHSASIGFDEEWIGVYLEYYIDDAPQITRVKDTDISNGQTHILIEGRSFGDNSGSAEVEYNSNSGGTGNSDSCTIYSWNDNRILIDCVVSNLSYGTNYLRVRNSSGTWSSTIQVNLHLLHYIDRIDTQNEEISNSDSVTIYGNYFYTPQGGNEKVQLCNTPTGTGSKNIDQTVTSWGVNSITITVVQSTLLTSERIWLIVTRDKSIYGDSSPRKSKGKEIFLI